MTAVFLFITLGVLGLALIVAHYFDGLCDRRWPSYARGWARAFGESEPERSHVRTVTPDDLRDRR